MVGVPLQVEQQRDTRKHFFALQNLQGNEVAFVFALTQWHARWHAGC